MLTIFDDDHLPQLRDVVRKFAQDRFADAWTALEKMWQCNLGLRLELGALSLIAQGREEQFDETNTKIYV